MSRSLAALSQTAFVPAAEGMPELIWLADTRAQCVYLNKALRTFWGLEMADLPRFDWSSTVHPDDRARLVKVVNEAMQTRAPFDVRARFRRSDGVFRMFDTHAEPRFAPNGEFLGMVGINVDVTGHGDR